ncbi:MAG: hypothetical protein R2834_22470 [Rhodothermales bacterium]
MLREVFYRLKPLIPRTMQIAMRRRLIEWQRRQVEPIWPIDPASATPPAGWTGWPDGAQFALVLTHDVEKSIGQSRSIQLAEMERDRGFRSSFNFVPERYPDNPSIRRQLGDMGFEVGVHGLNHDGKLYSSREEFMRRAVRINGYIASWGAHGFRSPAMHHNLEWLGSLDCDYDASTFDTDPFEPQPDGAGTIFPYMVPRADGRPPYVELPYTLPQDFTLFVLMGETAPVTWKRKLDWIAARGGMALLNVHPDYMHFGSGRARVEEYEASIYAEFLDYVTASYSGRFWHALPHEVAAFWRADRAGMTPEATRAVSQTSP